MAFWFWAGFIAFILVMLAIDLFLVNRKASEVSLRKAFAWTGIFASMGFLFSFVVYAIYSRDLGGFGTRFLTEYSRNVTDAGRTAAIQYLSGWLVEYALSMDNIFVIALIFTHFRIPGQFQHRVLFWGILGALVLRGVMIGAGAVLVHKFEWVLYLFGVVLLLTAIKILRTSEEHFDPEKSLIFRLTNKFFKVTPRLDGQKFFTVENGVRMATPLFLVLCIVEGTDVVFAVDSIPAIFSITQDPFLVFTSNAFAILGLRSLYFALAGAMNKFHMLKYSLALILAFIGVKMLLLSSHHVEALINRFLRPATPIDLPDMHVPSAVSLSVIAGTLLLGVIASLMIKPGEKHEPRDTPTPRV